MGSWNLHDFRTHSSEKQCVINYNVDRKVNFYSEQENKSQQIIIRTKDYTHLRSREESIFSWRNCLTYLRFSPHILTGENAHFDEVLMRTKRLGFHSRVWRLEEFVPSPLLAAFISSRFLAQPSPAGAGAPGHKHTAGPALARTFASRHQEQEGPPRS